MSEPRRDQRLVDQVKGWNAPADADECHCALCSRYRNNFGLCLWCGSRPGELRVEQRNTNYGLLARLRGVVNFGLAGLAVALLPICETCASGVRASRLLRADVRTTG